MRISLKHLAYLVYMVVGILIISGCGLFLDDELIANRYAEAHLTKNNELQFRFKLNEDFLEGRDLFKVRVVIHDNKLADAIGKKEIIYGEEQVIAGEYLEVKKNGQNYFLMAPLPLKKDLHIAELEKMISGDHAVSIEIFNDKEVIGRAYLNNFSSEI